MNNVYRVIDVKDGGINSIHVFHYNETRDEEITLLDKTEYETYKDLIGIKNYEELKKNTDIMVYIVNMNIFKDDTIETIKKKIIHAFEKSVSFEELYLFGMREEINNNADIFEILSQNDNLEIDSSRFFQFLQNFLDIDLDTINLDKEVYTFDDVISLNIDGKIKIKKFPLGSRFFVEKTYPVVNNPFDIIDFDKFLKNQGEDIVSTQNKSLLLDNSKLYENNIYICQAEKVLEYAQENDLDEELIIKM